MHVNSVPNMCTQTVERQDVHKNVSHLAVRAAMQAKYWARLCAGDLSARWRGREADSGPAEWNNVRHTQGEDARGKQAAGGTETSADSGRKAAVERLGGLIAV